MVSLSDLPGISSEGSRIRNVAVGCVYVFAILMILGAAAPAENTGANNTTTDAPAGTMTATAADSNKATAKQGTKQVTKQSTKQNTATAKPTQSPTQADSGSSGYSVKIIAEGDWSGSIMSGGSSRSVEGSGTETFELDGNPSIVSANAQKKGANSNKLTIQILKDGEVVQESSTSAEYGLAQVSTSALDSGNNEKKSEYTVKISYDGEWSGSIGGDGSMRTVDGSGTETFTIKGNPYIVSANAQKKDSGSGTLTIQILKNGEVIKEATTNAGYGLAQVSVTT